MAEMEATLGVSEWTTREEREERITGMTQKGWAMGKRDMEGNCSGREGDRAPGVTLKGVTIG